MYVMRWVFIVVTLLHIPINLFSTREMFYTFFDIKKNTKNSNMISVILTFLTFIFPIFVPNILEFLGLFGGIFATTRGYIIPLLLGYRMRGEFFADYRC